MYDAVRESAYGQLVRYLTKNKYFKYPEEIEGFQIPWTETTEQTDEKDAVTRPADSPATPSSESMHSVDQAKKEEAEDEPNITHQQSREDAAPFTEERMDVEQQLDVERTESRVIVPQKTKEGVILVDWYTTDDQANPQNWTTTKKVYVAGIVALYTFVVYSSSAIYTPAEGQLMSRYHLSIAEASTVLSLYVAGYGLGPLLFSPISEIPLFGRNLPYVVTFGLFVILAIPTALVDNYPGLLVLRFLTGFMGSPCLATGGASMGDIFPFIKLPYGLTVWVAAAFFAPAAGPLISGFATPVLGPHWPFWEILIMSGPVFVIWFFTIPETSADNILLRRAQRIRKLTGNDKYMAQSEINQKNMKFSKVLTDALVIPFVITIKDPAVLYTNLFTAFLYGVYYGFFEVLPLAYIGIYGFNEGELGIVYICCIGTGALLGIGTYVAYQWFYLEPDLRKRGPRENEHRLVPAAIFVWFLPVALFWFGWTVRKDIPWIVSIIGLMFFAYGAFVMFQAVFMYLPMTYPRYAASLFAANDAMRAAFAAGAIIWSHPMYVKLGIGRGVSILAGLTVGGAICMVGLYFIGGKLRARSKFTGM